MNTSLKVLINFLKIANEHTRKFSWWLDGLWFNEFVILYHVVSAPEKKLRRTDLAEKLWLTAAWVTRILWPMEKIGLVARQSSPHDARVSYVTLTESGERNVNESLSRAVELAEKMFPPQKIEQFLELNKLLVDLWAPLP